METRGEIRLSLIILISFFIHLVFIVGVLLPDYRDFFGMEDSMKKSFSTGRNIIVNINQNEERRISRRTLLSDKDSVERGHITKKKGDAWISNSLDFKIWKGGVKSRSSENSEKSTRKKVENVYLSDDSSVVALIEKRSPKASIAGSSGFFDKIEIPQKDAIKKQNSLFYSNTGAFSFNTAKFKHYEYFRNMIHRISSNWYPPVMANAVLGGYAPGKTRIMAIPPQDVKVFFTLNREGDVLGVYLVDSYGNKSLDSSCTDAIRLSKNFSRVPNDIKGDVIGIPFMFRYITY